MRTLVVVEQKPIAVESVVARNTVKRVVYVAPVLLAVFLVTSGWLGLWSSALGIAIVVGNFLLAGWILSISARISLSVYHAAALFGFFLRLGLITISLFVLLQFVEIDRLAFGISVAVAYMTLLTLEAVAVAKGKERNLDWTT